MCIYIYSVRQWFEGTWHAVVERRDGAKFNNARGKTRREGKPYAPPPRLKATRNSMIWSTYDRRRVLPSHLGRPFSTGAKSVLRVKLAFRIRSPNGAFYLAACSPPMLDATRLFVRATVNDHEYFIVVGAGRVASLSKEKPPDDRRSSFNGTLGNPYSMYTR